MSSLVTPVTPSHSTADHFAIADELVQEFAATAVQRDRQGGTAQAERDRIRQSGLLKLIIPQPYGGWGETWETALHITRRFATVDSSIAHLFSYHHLGVVAPHVFGNPEQAQRYYTLTAERNWFWCNGFNPLDRRVVLTPDGDGFRLNGTKSFCSGSVDSDLIPVSAVQEGFTTFRIVIVPTQREGVLVHGDWDNMGQRQTDSGSISFSNVRIEADEILSPIPEGEVFKTFRSCLTQVTFTNIYLGITQGAFEAAKQYTQTQTRPWLTSGVESATQDPYILLHYGEMAIALEAATLLADRATQLVQTAWDKGYDLTPEERGECALAIAKAKAFVTKTGLDITSKIFEVMGTRATAASYGFDRYWRNLRTFTLHDPVDYKIRAVGNWALNHELPKPDFYS
ncbi:acyl-CoA dehydrogenase family protein [Oscillatoria sp. FACHB-1407]|uniref:acyl-CoA dehydrogenase family protein n=1 Tax=Oscillatoria sp. FACHB-1407 TaxID=2692847 RepID=UPI001688201D|nr:acyl-CoA dehydrogenase family protein [Oscillatoria sp. FACHB-1407]MBD2463189.1 acyl-CoA dehydrogenase family protein [Oscillatoria sp. FACHB-1407]